VVSSDFEEVIGLADRIVVMSDGASVTDIPSRLVDIEKLAMFAAPRSSAERTHTMLESLVAAHGGTAYWIDIDGPRLFCFDRVDGAHAADPGFAGGGFPEIDETRISRALTAAADGLVTEADGRLASLLVPVHGRRGHRLGLVGLTLADVPPGFDAAAVRRQVLTELDARSEAA
jgi:ribose transport system ATP-binding protein/rhamnose transport system ATP-binding protein